MAITEAVLCGQFEVIVVDLSFFSKHSLIIFVLILFWPEYFFLGFDFNLNIIVLILYLFNVFLLRNNKNN
jgi:hypothetical protein